MHGYQQQPFQFRNYGYATVADTDNENNTTRFSPPKCGMCGEASEPITLDLAKFRRWRVQGELIQDVWPEFDLAMREWLMTGTHGPCFDEMFKGDE